MPCRKSNRVDTACLVLTDCGGIYVEAPDEQPLQTAITGNTIVNVGGMQKLAWGIVLDNFANGVTVSNNAVTRNANGLEIHDGFNNTISETVFPSACRPTSR
jgi:parallel beta-helix repeat protein/putative cofactor-binding repeat protein